MIILIDLEDESFILRLFEMSVIREIYMPIKIDSEKMYQSIRV